MIFHYRFSFVSGSKVSCKVLEILDNRQIRKDIPMLSTGPQTALVETFHSILNHFAPKMYAFKLEGQHCRSASIIYVKSTFMFYTQGAHFL